VQHAPGALPGQAPAAGVEEDRRGTPHRRPGQGGPGPDQVGLHGAHGVASHRHYPVLAPLADQPHHRILGVQLEFVDIEAGRLGDPGPGPVKELEQRPVPQLARVDTGRGPGGRGVWAGASRGEQAFDLGEGDRLGQPPGRRGRRDVSRGVQFGQALRDRERVQPADRDHGPGGRTDRKRRVLLIALPQRGEELRHVGGGDITQPGRAVVGQHRNVPEQVPAVGLDRVRRQPALHHQVLQVAAERGRQRLGHLLADAR